MLISASSRRSTLLSAGVHGAAILALVFTFRLHPITVRPRSPGIAEGTKVTLFYERGGPPAAPVKPAPVQRSAISPIAPKLPEVAPEPSPSVPVSPAAGSGAGASGEASLGDGDIRIALVQFHPRPSPDLSTLPHGTAGDIVLDAIIDAQGKISSLTVTRSLGSAIDKDVIATVGQWTFSPATRDGIPTASEQEILFHYERS